MTGGRTEIRSARGLKARRDGRWAEATAALWLMAKGWRVIGFRLKTAEAEIDLLARRGRVLAVVEVKRRRSLDEALAAVAPQQRSRLRAAGAALAARRPDLGDLAVRLDLVALGPLAVGLGGLPRHLPDAWPQDLDSGVHGGVYGGARR